MRCACRPLKLSSCKVAPTFEEDVDCLHGQFTKTCTLRLMDVVCKSTLHICRGPVVTGGGGQAKSHTALLSNVRIRMSKSKQEIHDESKMTKVMDLRKSLSVHRKSLNNITQKGLMLWMTERSLPNSIIVLNESRPLKWCVEIEFTQDRRLHVPSSWKQQQPPELSQHEATTAQCREKLAGLLERYLTPRGTP